MRVSWLAAVAAPLVALATPLLAQDGEVGTKTDAVEVDPATLTRPTLDFAPTPEIDARAASQGIALADVGVGGGKVGIGAVEVEILLKIGLNLGRGSEIEGRPRQRCRIDLDGVGFGPDFVILCQ